MIDKHKFYSITLVSLYFVFTLVNRAVAALFAYITNLSSNNVFAIDNATNTVAAAANGSNSPDGVGVDTDGNVQVVNSGKDSASVIDIATKLS